MIALNGTLELFQDQAPSALRRAGLSALVGLYRRRDLLLDGV